MGLQTEIGQNKAQSLDYFYTLQGWIKGVNAPNLDCTIDVGRDGDNDINNINRNSAIKDAFGFSLTYYDGDYTQRSISANSPNVMLDLTNARPVNQRGLYNGNIAGQHR